MIIRKKMRLIPKTCSNENILEDADLTELGLAVGALVVLLEGDNDGLSDATGVGASEGLLVGERDGASETVGAEEG